ncbi:MAG: caspase family protein [Bacteroidales bacterium]|jgi:hypothetical protein|nr:caspase family protein [Bacteroidales bacterium]
MFRVFMIIAGLLAWMCLDGQVISGKSEPKKINISQSAAKVSMVREFPDLVITGEVFEDENQNNVIDANEKCRISINVDNIGKGMAKKVIIKVSAKGEKITGLTFNETMELGDIAGDTRKPVSFQVSGATSLADGMAEFVIEVREEMGFDAFPLEMKIETRKFASPKIVVADAAFGTEEGGVIKLNYPITLKVIVQNIGQGDASGVFAEFQFPNLNCVVLGETNRFEIGKLKRGESRELDFLFTATRRYETKEIPVKIDLGESLNKYARDTVMTVGLQQELVARNQVVIAGIATAEEDIQIRSLSSDVDKNLPANSRTNPGRYALIIGNEDYSRYQKNLQTEANVPFARNDARVFRDYAVKTLGVPEDNMYLLLDATAGEMQQKIDLISKLAAKTGAEAEVIMFYAGHGFPDEVEHNAYLIPVDVTGSNLASAVKLQDIYDRLGQTGAKRITIMLDACFSGGGRDAPLMAARSVKVKPRQDYITGNMVVFTASSGEQMALPLDSQQHGLFTYYLLKKIQESSGKVTYGEMADYLAQKISIESLKVNQKEQDPQVQVSTVVESEWKNWKFYE